MANEDIARGWSNVVPEVYYDIIARIPAGAILVIAIVSSILGMPMTEPGEGALKMFSTLTWAPATIFLILLLVASYSAGLMLTALGNISYSLWRKYLWRKACNDYKDQAKEPWKARLKNLASAQCKGSSIDKTDRDMHYWLKSRNPHAKQILPKMRAEAALAHNALAASVLSIVFSIVVWKLQGHDILAQVTQLSVLALLLLLCGAAAPFRSWSYIRTQLTFLALEQQRDSNAGFIVESVE